MNTAKRANFAALGSRLAELVPSLVGATICDVVDEGDRWSVYLGNEAPLSGRWWVPDSEMLAHAYRYNLTPDTPAGTIKPGWEYQMTTPAAAPINLAAIGSALAEIDPDVVGWTIVAAGQGSENVGVVIRGPFPHSRGEKNFNIPLYQVDEHEERYNLSPSTPAGKVKHGRDYLCGATNRLCHPMGTKMVDVACNLRPGHKGPHRWDGEDGSSATWDNNLGYEQFDEAIAAFSGAAHGGARWRAFIDRILEIGARVPRSESAPRPPDPVNDYTPTCNPETKLRGAEPGDSAVARAPCIATARPESRQRTAADLKSKLTLYVDNGED